MFRQFSQSQNDADTSDNGNALASAIGLGSQVEPEAEFSDHDPRGTFWIDLKTRMHERLLDMLNLSAIEKVAPSDLRREVSTIVNQLLAKEGVALNAKEFQQIVEEILNEVLGLGPLEPLLKDPTIGDILVNTHNHVYVERQGRLEMTSVRFKDERHLLRIIDKIVSAVGRRVDESQPWVDARLPDGSRVNAIVPPCALDGPLLSIRKFGQSPMTIDKLVEKDALTPQIAHILQGITRARLNLIISGGTGSGKTTMLNAISSFIGQRERIITIEDAAELQLQQFHVVRMETRPPNIEGRGSVTQRELLRNALRMRPDRIIVGEVRGAEALDMLQAMNTGHDGSMTTIHANTPRDALSRLEQMIMMTGVQFPLHSMRQQLASAIDVVIQLERMADGKRRMVSVQEITGMERDIVTMQEIFSYQREGIDEQGTVIGHFEASGVRPKFADRLRAFGVELPGDLFNTKRKL
jgi:pilus assembly protein CpaF